MNKEKKPNENKKNTAVGNVILDAMKVRVRHPKGGMVIGKIVRYDSGSPHYSPFYIVDIGERQSVKAPAHEVEAENHDELTKQYTKIFAEVQRRLSNNIK